MGWREEIVTALDTQIAHEDSPRRRRWRRVGRAVPEEEAGRYLVDIRGSDLSPDQLAGDGVRLAGPDEAHVEAGYPVMDIYQDGTALRVRVAEFADLPEPHLWIKPQPPAFLLKALREGIATLSDAPLAEQAARGRAGGRLAPVGLPENLLLPAQDLAYRACAGEGLWLVWGPPGTGKTTVLRRAISDLIASGKRVLLVSATNIAVDNALLGVVKEGRHGEGHVVRVGPPHLRDIAENSAVCLSLMVRERLAGIEAQRRAVAGQLAEFRARAAELAALDSLLVGFDAEAHTRDRELLVGLGGSPERVRAELAEAEQAAERAAARAAEAQARSERARQALRDAEPARRDWARHDEAVERLRETDESVAHLEARALVAVRERDSAQAHLAELESRSGFARLRARSALADAREAVRQAEAAAVAAEANADRARAVLARSRPKLAAGIERARAGIALSREAIVRREQAARTALADDRTRAGEADFAASRVAGLRSALPEAEAAWARVSEAERRGHPRHAARAERLRLRTAADAAHRDELERQHTELQEQYEKLARDAQGEIIRAARLVATTLARFRTNRAVFEGEYDLVLVDEAGTAMLPEILLAVGKAKRTAVLLGDFMQLGPVKPRLDDRGRPDIARWLLTEVFEHFGIASAAEAGRHDGCIVLDVQHRFGADVMALANSLAYDGTLKAGPGVERRAQTLAEDDPEIVLLDTDGLGELASVNLVSRSSGWWPAGALLARALVELHQEDGEPAGIVTPYKAQAETTLEALRDMESGDRLPAEVGTAHRFQGREFPVVIFDMVEDDYNDGLWMAKATRRAPADAWARNGVRLFNVAVTRVQTRLYIIGSRWRVRNAGAEGALGQLGALIDGRRVRSVPATRLVAPTAVPGPELGPFGSRLAEVLSRHVEVAAVDDEISFYRTFTDRIAEARTSLWIWSPWTATRLTGLLPALSDAVGRGVRVTVFVRDPSDRGQRDRTKLVRELRSVVHTVVPVNVMHQKIVVIDEHTVLLGSLNALSQSRSREIMLTIRGAHFARKILAHEHAESFAAPPRCGACGGDEVDLRRYGKGEWYWRCYAGSCPARSGRTAWKTPVRLSGRR
ncbi:AAA domain-containing protein [Streptomyces sp. MP131-18]|uniref:AAA domain-containing protein n=1 Tax=Streptomyces sp. MP131-18 TaxID=1857892 RepID=UPI00097CB2B7|nr:AAA domain-containing protein [Streptomyces sp. MP131-18]ONK15215.1 putative DNA helicase [Streptomyces sp. MP131-18]